MEINMKKTIPSVEDTVSQDYSRFLTDAEQLLNSARQLSGDSAALARQKLEDRVAQAKIRLESARSAAAEQAEYALQSTRDWVTERPLQVAVAALGIAVLLGWWWNRRD
jgi:ElaB/YqjD/DUF883 family membrane-anchored ribosome-binding protein